MGHDSPISLSDSLSLLTYSIHHKWSRLACGSGCNKDDDVWAWVEEAPSLSDLSFPFSLSFASRFPICHRFICVCVRVSAPETTALPAPTPLFTVRQFRIFRKWPWRWMEREIHTHTHATAAAPSSSFPNRPTDRRFHGRFVRMMMMHGVKCSLSREQ